MKKFIFISFAVAFGVVMFTRALEIEGFKPDSEVVSKARTYPHEFIISHAPLS